MHLTKTLRSSTFRLAIVVIALFGTAICALLGHVYFAAAAFVSHQSDSIIALEADDLIRSGGTDTRDALIAAIGRRSANRALRDRVYLLVDPAYRLLAGNLPDWPADHAQAEGWANFHPDSSRGSNTSSEVRAIYHTLPDGSHLLVGRTADDLGKFIDSMKVEGIGVAAMFLALAAIAGLGVSMRSVLRIETIVATSREIMRTGLNRRIPMRGTNDEWDHLAASLNSMLDRIEELLHGIKQVSDNIAHDLRTPLTRIRGRLEVVYNHRLPLEEYERFVGTSIAELDDVLKAFASLLRISEIEVRDRKANFRDIDLSVVIVDVAELFEPAAEDKGGSIRIVGTEAVLVSADRDLLFEAFSNLLDNAIKHGGGAVTITCGSRGEYTVLSVSDRGPGIPTAERRNVFRRFFRLERSRTTAGSGLGLSLVSAVAELHGARIELSDNAPGLTVSLIFPRREVARPG